MKSSPRSIRLPAVFADWFAALHINEVRVAQSVALLGQMPVVVFINALSILIFVSSLSAARPMWMRIVATGIIWALLVPILLSWKRLRHRPEPASVSRRRIISIIRHSTLLGMTWSALIVYFLRGESDALITLMVAGMGFLCVGGTAILASVPLACLGFSIPLLTTSAYLTLTASLPQSMPVLELLSLLAFGVVWVAVRGWMPMREIISLKSENAKLINNLQHEVKRFKALADLSSDWYWEQDDQFRFVADFSKERAVFTDLRRSNIGKTRWECSTEIDPLFWQSHLNDLNAHRKFTDFEYPLNSSDGKQLWLSISGEPCYDNSGIFLGYHGVGKNITERKINESKIQQLAYFDPLTDLPNRRCLMERLSEMNASCLRTGQFATMLVIDLDHFKNINDEHGHEIGDELLKLIAQRLRSAVRLEDIAARMGGDEFVVLGTNIGNSADIASHNACAFSDRILAALVSPVFLAGHAYTVSCSIGLTLFPTSDQKTGGLLREADTAMYRAKATGRNRTMLFDASMHVAVQERLKLATDLALAEKNQELALHFQSQVDPTGITVGGEMLLRWTHPARGNVSPGAFISVAEDSGLIIALGDWVMRTACATSVRLSGSGAAFPLSINVSPNQFKQPNFVARVQSILDETNANPYSLIFEVTENLLIDDFDATIERMNALANLGIRFSIDDFGTGYSSMAYLRRLPLYELKIDRTFINDLPGDSGGAAIVSAILAMAKHLGLRVVAEGVETLEQAAFLNAAGCDCMQGFLFCRPMPVEEWQMQKLQAIR